MPDGNVPAALHFAAWAPLTAFTATLVLVWWLATGRLSTILLDHPKSRSLHKTPIPRTGGIGLHAGLIAALGILRPELPMALWISFAGILVVSFLDDAQGIQPAWRLMVHLCACIFFAHATVGQYGPIAVLIATLTCTWMANLYNFMDGSDGLAGGMAIAGFSFLGIAALLAGQVTFAVVNFSVAASALAFLVFNFYPARIFLGDVGSVPLGFLAAAFGIVGWLQEMWMWWFPFVVFSPFVVDATATLIRRALKFEKVWQAHHGHYYQRVVRMGWGHRKTAIIEYVIMMIVGTVGLVALRLPSLTQTIILMAIGIAYAALMRLIDLNWRRHLATGQT